MTQFRETGSLKNKEQVENPVRNKGIEVAVLGDFVMDPTLSTLKFVIESGVTRTIVQRMRRPAFFIKHVFF